MRGLLPVRLWKVEWKVSNQTRPGKRLREAERWLREAGKWLRETKKGKKKLDGKFPLRQDKGKAKMVK